MGNDGHKVITFHFCFTILRNFGVTRRRERLGVICILTLQAPSLQNGQTHPNTRKRCEICSKLTIKTPEHQNDVIDVVLVFLLLTLNIFRTFF